MSEPERYGPGIPCWIDLEAPDAEAARAFYGALFGWEFEDRGGYVVARLGGLDVAGVNGQPAGSHAAAGWNTYVWVRSAERTAANAATAGGTVVGPPAELGALACTAEIVDPTGAPLRLWEARDLRGALAVNVPGTWNWSMLETPDPPAAGRFYTAVFAWEASPMDFGGATSWMLRSPGYADLLERRDPGIRARHAEAGAPEGFSDAIGWMMPASAGAPPGWSITFAVDGTDAVAERAAGLGATVVVPPFDAEPTRVAVLRDPEGAGFSVSTYSPG